MQSPAWPAQDRPGARGLVSAYRPGSQGTKQPAGVWPARPLTACPYPQLRSQKGIRSMPTIQLIPSLPAALVVARFHDGEVLVLVDADQSAGRVLDPPKHDPLALVRVGPQQLIGGRPAGMLGRGMPL
jgi:hypothetical protein